MYLTEEEALMSKPAPKDVQFLLDVCNRNKEARRTYRKMLSPRQPPFTRQVPFRTDSKQSLIESAEIVRAGNCAQLPLKARMLHIFEYEKDRCLDMQYELTRPDWARLHFLGSRTFMLFAKQSYYILSFALLPFFALQEKGASNA